MIEESFYVLQAGATKIAELISDPYHAAETLEALLRLVMFTV